MKLGVPAEVVLQELLHRQSLHQKLHPSLHRLQCLLFLQIECGTISNNNYKHTLIKYYFSIAVEIM